MKKIAIVQTSLREGSNTDIVCKAFIEKAEKKWLDITSIDLRDLKLEFCDGRNLDEYNSDLQNTYTQLEEVDAIVFWMPVYQYSMSWVLKNFIDICGWALAGKQIWIIVNAGGPNCYMASRDLFDALYYEYATKNLAPTPYSWSMDFKDGKLINTKVEEKLEELIKSITEL